VLRFCGVVGVGDEVDGDDDLGAHGFDDVYGEVVEEAAVDVLVDFAVFFLAEDGGEEARDGHGGS
jgi:hypothetical protein